MIVFTCIIVCFASKTLATKQTFATFINLYRLNDSLAGLLCRKQAKKPKHSTTVYMKWLKQKTKEI
jgi:hypothetical protein